MGVAQIVSSLLFPDIQNTKWNQPLKLSKRPKSWIFTKFGWKFKLIISVQFNVSKLVKIFASWFQAKIRQRGRRDFLLRSQSFFNPLLAQLVTANLVYQLIHSRISKVVDSAHESWVDRQTAFSKEGSREKRHLSLSSEAFPHLFHHYPGQLKFSKESHFIVYWTFVFYPKKIHEIIIRFVHI